MAVPVCVVLVLVLVLELVLVLVLRGNEGCWGDWLCRLLVLVLLQGLEVLLEVLLPALEIHLLDTRRLAGRVEDPGAVLEPESVESEVLAFRFLSLVGLL